MSGLVLELGILVVLTPNADGPSTMPKELARGGPDACRVGAGETAWC